MKYKDLTGCTFGRLTVIKRSGKSSDGKIMWECQCSCNKIKRIQGGSLKNGSTKSCGCLQSEIARTNRFKEIEKECSICNKKFKSKSGPRTKTCSESCHRARRNEYIRLYSKQDFEHIIKYLINRSRQRAIKNKIKHTITYKQLLSLFKKQNGKCAITNLPFEINNNKGVKGRSPQSISLDRINNSKGYTIDNVQFVTVMYNLCKNTWTHKDVILFSKQVLRTDR